ncbi:MAG TPA: sensor histidine kinase [Solirubrobacteraceae bacterium]|nr:sensor histidine kinase [Solirubrobacteraceae bacterium]
MNASLEAWEQRQTTVFAAIRYGLLAVCTLVTVFIGSSRLVVIGLSVVTALWMLWWERLHPAWRERSGLMAVYFVGLVALMAALVSLAPWYGFFSFTGYFSVVNLPPRWWPLGVFAVALVTGTSQNGGLPSGGAGDWAIWAVIVLVNVAVAGAIIFFTWIDEVQKDKKSQLVEELTEVNERLEASLRENAGLHAQLVAQAREAGVNDERQRMARELHDTLAQGLAGIITQLEAAEQSGGDATRHLAAARQLARESLTEARRSVDALRPEPLVAARLPEAIEGEAARWSALNGIAAEVTVTGAARPLRPEIEVTLLRAAQEALANVAKHAGAHRVGLTLSYMEDLVTLDVRDDGAGFAVNGGAVRANGDGGFGLIAMRERVEELAGRLEVESEPGAGTALSISVPAIPAQVAG